MKVKLLKKLRKRGRNKVSIHSITSENGTNTGMRLGYDDSIYSGLFCFGDTEEDVKKKAEHIYIESYLNENRKSGG